MKLMRGLRRSGLYLVCKDFEQASKLNWLFGVILQRKRICLNGYYNAWELIPSKGGL